MSHARSKQLASDSIHTQALNRPIGIWKKFELVALADATRRVIPNRRSLLHVPMGYIMDPENTAYIPPNGRISFPTRYQASLFFFDVTDFPSALGL
jgi:hypothetical protein